VQGQDSEHDDVGGRRNGDRCQPSAAARRRHSHLSPVELGCNKTVPRGDFVTETRPGRTVLPPGGQTLTGSRFTTM
jgi:hypothetical protein